MRDPNRIDLLLAKVAEYWHKYPDLRFGQLMICILSTCKQDAFNMEDDDWMEHLQAFIDGRDN